MFLSTDLQASDDSFGHFRWNIPKCEDLLTTSFQNLFIISRLKV